MSHVWRNCLIGAVRYRHVFGSLIGVVCLLLCGDVALGHAQDRKPQAGIRRIGVLLPLSGAMSRVGEEVLIGVEFAQYQASQTNRISLVYEDDACDEKQAVEAFRRLVFEERVSMVIGPVCREAITAVAQFAEKLRVPIFALGDVPESVRAMEQVYAVAYDFAREVALLQSYFERRNIERVAAMLVTTEVDESGVYGQVRSILRKRAIEIDQLPLAEMSPAAVRRNIVQLQREQPDVLFFSARMINAYPGVVEQLSRLKIPSLAESGVQTGGVALARVHGWRGLAAKPQLGESGDNSLALKRFAAAHFQAREIHVWYPSLGYTIVDLLQRVLEGATLDIHEALRAHPELPVLLKGSVQEGLHVYVVRPTLFTANEVNAEADTQVMNQE